MVQTVIVIFRVRVVNGFILFYSFHIINGSRAQNQQQTFVGFAVEDLVVTPLFCL